MKKAITIALVAFALMTNVFTDELKQDFIQKAPITVMERPSKIKSLLNYTIGQEVDKGKFEKVENILLHPLLSRSRANTLTNLYKFIPDNGITGFADYFLQITPVTSKVYGIIAISYSINENADGYVIQEERKARNTIKSSIIKALHKKFKNRGLRYRKGIYTSGARFIGLKTDDGDAETYIDNHTMTKSRWAQYKKFNEIRIFLICQDTYLKQIADKEDKEVDETVSDEIADQIGL